MLKMYICGHVSDHKYTNYNSRQMYVINLSKLIFFRVMSP